MTQRTAKASPPQPSGNLWLVAVLLVFAAAMTWVFFRPAAAIPQATSTASASEPAAQTAPPVDPAQVLAPPDQTAPPKPGAKGPLPPLPVVNFAPLRPPEVVRAVYEFAARRPDVLQYMPCYCGCEHSGHSGNDDCFVAARDTDGNVTWDEHAMSCAVCLDIARDAMQMTASGASVGDIRLAVERRYGGRYGYKTPTPPAPHPMP